MDQQRSFNLVRLRAIEVSRNLAATSFYQEELNLTTDQSSVADNNNSNSGSIDNLPDPVSGAGRASERPSGRSADGDPRGRVMTHSRLYCRHL